MIYSIHIHLNSQTLTLTTPDFSKTYPVSTAANGAGQSEGSYCTPLGHHIIKEKFGHRMPLDTVFTARVPEHDPYTETRGEELPERDWILSRILWLGGCEPGINRLGNVDTKKRYIYIHGTPDSEEMGVPRSHGCIRMRTSDVAELFDHVPLYTHVLITEE